MTWLGFVHLPPQFPAVGAQIDLEPLPGPIKIPESKLTAPWYSMAEIAHLLDGAGALVSYRILFHPSAFLLLPFCTSPHRRWPGRWEPDPAIQRD